MIFLFLFVAKSKNGSIALKLVNLQLEKIKQRIKNSCDKKLKTCHILKILKTQNLIKMYIYCQDVLFTC